LWFETFLNSNTSGNIARIIYDMFTYESESARGWDFKCRIETEALLTCQAISETRQDRTNVITTDH